MMKTKFVRALVTNSVIEKGHLYEAVEEIMVPTPFGGEEMLYIIRLPNGHNTAASEQVVTPCRRSANLSAILDE